jgi:hypothetical protein
VRIEERPALGRPKSHGIQRQRGEKATTGAGCESGGIRAGQWHSAAKSWAASFGGLGYCVPLGSELCNGLVSLNYLDQGALNLRVGHARCCCQGVLSSIVPEPRIVYTSSTPSHGSSLADLFGLARPACLFSLSAPTAPWAHTDCQKQSAPARYDMSDRPARGGDGRGGVWTRPVPLIQRWPSWQVSVHRIGLP